MIALKSHWLIINLKIVDFSKKQTELKYATKLEDKIVDLLNIQFIKTIYQF